MWQRRAMGEEPEAKTSRHPRVPREQDEVIEELRKAASRRPKDPRPLVDLRDALISTGRYAEAVSPARRSSDLAPDDRGALLGLGKLYLQVGMPIHGARVLRRYLERFGDDGSFPFRQALEDIDRPFAEQASRYGVEIAALEEAMFRMFEGYLAIQLRDGKKALEGVDRALEVVPRLVPALNNRAGALLILGRLEEAEAAARLVAEEVDPGNAVALAMLVQVLVYRGERDRALPYGEQLRHRAGRPEFDQRQVARGLALLEDDQAVYRSLWGCENLDTMEARLLATAATNLGKRDEAIGLWQEYLRRVGRDPRPGEAIRELKAGRPVRLPYYHLMDLVQVEVVDAFLGLADREEKGNTRAHGEMLQLVERHPQFLLGAEMALRDPEIAELGIILLKRMRTPAAIAALRGFVESQHGTREARHKAGQALVEIGALSRKDAVRFWDGEEWTQVAFTVVDLVLDEPNPLPPASRSRYVRAIGLLEAGSPDQALSLLEELAREYPRMPMFHNDMGAALMLLGREEESVAARLRAVEADPNYVFARAFLAHRALDEGDAAAAQEWIEPLLDLTRMHPRAYASILHVQGRLALDAGNVDQTRNILETMRDLGPTEEMCGHLEELIRQHRRGSRGSRAEAVEGATPRTSPLWKRLLGR